MASKIDRLLEAYEGVLSEPWVGRLSSKERTWFLVYDPSDQRKLDLRVGDFEAATQRSGRKWVTISMKPCFPKWMATHDYRDAYFEDPESMMGVLDDEFKPFAIGFLNDRIQEANPDDKTVIALRDVTSLFGFVLLSEVLEGRKDFTGRMLVFFAGEYDQIQYRLLDARDGWSYLARPITV